ncbi:hypothetical protein OYC64_005130 [Pagothenia borchgrevinki]
MVENGHT